MDLSIGIALLVMLVGLVYLCINKAWATLFGFMFLAGLVALLLKFSGHASLRIG